MIEFHFNKDFRFEGRCYILLLMLFLGVIEPHAGLNVPNLIYFGCVLFLLILQIFVPIIHHKNYPVGSYHFHWEFYNDPKIYFVLFLARSFFFGFQDISNPFYWILALLITSSFVRSFIMKEKNKQSKQFFKHKELI